MRLKLSWSNVAVLAAAILLPLKAGACGSHTACFTFSQAAYAKHGNACPAAMPAALNRFSSNACGTLGPISSVDGEGSFDGEFCCYPVTEASNFFDCSGSGGFVNTATSIGGFGGSGGFGGFGGFMDTTSSTGGFSASSGTDGGMPMCFTCNDELNGVSMDPGQLCSAAAMFWSALNTCNCGSGPCTMACSATACSGIMPSPECKTCMTDSGAAGCGAELAACKAH